MKRLKPAVAIGIFAIFVGCLVALAWFGRYYLSLYLNTSHTYGVVQVHFQGHSSGGLLDHRWNSIRVEGPGFDVAVQKPQVKAHIMLSPTEDFIHVDMDTVKAKIQPSQFPKSENDTAAFAIPDFRIPLDARVRIGHVQADVDSVGSWSVDSLKVKPLGNRAAQLSFQEAQGDYLERKISGKVILSWQGEFLSANVKAITEDNDSVTVALNAPQNSLSDLSGTAELHVKNPKKLVKGAIPKSVSIKDIHVNASFSANAEKKKFSYDARLRTKLGAFWPLPALNADLRVQSNEKMNFVVNGKLTGKNSSQRIDIRGRVDKNLNGKVNVNIQGIEALFGPRFQPLDCSVSATKNSKDALSAHVITKAGSIVNAEISGLDKGPFNIDFTGDIAANEAWTRRWSGEHLKLNTRPQVKGSFHDGKLHADVAIAPVEYAYTMKADSVFTSLVLDKNGIDFIKGFIRTSKENFTFTGDVKWKDSIPHTSWQVNQSDGGYGKAFITLDLEMESEAHKVRLSTIPFADTTLLQGLDGIATGTFNQNFEFWNGNIELDVETEIAQIPLNGHFQLHNSIDSISLDKALISTGTNSIEIEGSALLHYDSTEAFFTSAKLVDVWASTDKFDIPLLLAPYEKSPLATGMFSGNVSYRKGSGLQGSLQFSNLSLKNVSPDFFSIPKLDVFAETEKMQISGNISAGERTWNGDLQIDVNGLLEPKRHIFAYFTTPVGGTAWLDGDIDSTFKWSGKAQLTGSWFLPENMGEIVYTDFKADATGDLRHFLDSLNLSFHSDSTAIDTKRGFPILPVSFSGTFKDGIFNIPDAKLTNSQGESILASASYNLKSGTLGSVDINTDQFSLTWNQIHHIRLSKINGHLEDSEKEFTLSLQLDTISYKLNKPEWGDADASAHGTAIVHLPHAVNGSFANPTIEGNFLLNRAVYKKDFSVEIGFGSLSKISATLSGFFTKVRRTRPPLKKTAAKSRPLNLSLHISDSQRDTIAILTNLANFPLTVDLWVLGTTDHPLLRGDINNSANGTIGLKDLFQFDLESFAISFQDVPWDRGTIHVSSVQNLPYCKTTENRDEDETCPVHLDILGTLTAPKPMPSANCGVDDSPASLYYSVLLGCMSEEENSTIDRNKVAGKLIGSVLTTTANKTLGGEYVGDISMKLKLFDEETISEKDSSYLMIPISLDRWVKDLSFVFGYKQDQSETPTYDRALEAGITYTIPAFSEEDKTKNPEHYSPKLDFGANLISKNYITTTDEDEHRLEKNVGFHYSYKFWSPRLFGFGKTSEEKKKEKEAEKEKK